MTVVVTILVFSFLIFFHEFGHFMAAKLSGIDVLEFAIGMGPAIFKKEKNGTLYSIRVFPIGGYCKMEERKRILKKGKFFVKTDL
jgi:regulator of sigma E protease